MHIHAHQRAKKGFQSVSQWHASGSDGRDERQGEGERRRRGGEEEGEAEGEGEEKESEMCTQQLMDKNKICCGRRAMSWTREERRE